MTEIDPARKRGDGGGEEAATGRSSYRSNKQIIGCESGVAMPFGGEIWWWGLLVCVSIDRRDEGTTSMLGFYLQLQQWEIDGHVISSCKPTQFASWIHDAN